MIFELETSEKYIVGRENNFSYQTAQPIGKVENQIKLNKEYIIGCENNFSYQTAPPIGKFLKFIQILKETNSRLDANKLFKIAFLSTQL